MMHNSHCLHSVSLPSGVQEGRSQLVACLSDVRGATQLGRDLLEGIALHHLKGVLGQGGEAEGKTRQGSGVYCTYNIHCVHEV